MIYGGIYEEGSSLSDADGYRLDVLEAVKDVNVSILRWPGGNFCSSNYGADWIGWNRTVLQTLRNEIDYIAIHTYINNRTDDFEQYVAWSQRIDQYIEVTAALIREVQAGRNNPPPIYFPLVEFAKQGGNVALDVWSASPMYRPNNNRPELGYLDISATYDADAGEIYLNVLNRSADRDLTTRIEIQEGAPGSSVSIWEMNHPDLKATHTFGDDEEVRPATRTVDLTVEDNTFTYTFPAHSLTILRIPLR